MQCLIERIPDQEAGIQIVFLNDCSTAHYGIIQMMTSVFWLLESKRVAGGFSVFVRYPRKTASVQQMISKRLAQKFLAICEVKNYGGVLC